MNESSHSNYNHNLNNPSINCQRGHVRKFHYFCCHQKSNLQWRQLPRKKLPFQKIKIIFLCMPNHIMNKYFKSSTVRRVWRPLVPSSPNADATIVLFFCCKYIKKITSSVNNHHIVHAIRKKQKQQNAQMCKHQKLK